MGGLGILGGTFNPPHVGHLACARHAYRQLDLRRVLVMPANAPPHKAVDDDPGPEHRLEMCALAVTGDYRLLGSSLEVRRPGPSYTVDTLRVLHGTDPSIQLTFILGGDVAATLPEWREPETILELARLAIAERDGIGRDQVRRALAPLGFEDRIGFLDMPRLDVSSTQVRERVAKGLPIRRLVSARVAEYIAERRLYLPGGPGGSPTPEPVVGVGGLAAPAPELGAGPGGGMPIPIGEHGAGPGGRSAPPRGQAAAGPGGPQPEWRAVVRR